MGSLSTRLRPAVPATSHANVQMLKLDDTVVMEVRGRRIEPQTRRVDGPKNKKPRPTGRDRTTDGIDPQRQEAKAAESTVNRSCRTGADDRPSEGDGACVVKNDHHAVDDCRTSTEASEKCAEETTNRAAVAANR